MKTIYLCGGINGMDDSECRGWRNLVKSDLGGDFLFLDPMRRDYRGHEYGNEEDIITGDIADIDSSDIVLVNAQRPSWGTAMELFYAFRAGKTVISICSATSPSPWLVGHSTYHVSCFEAAIDLCRKHVIGWRHDQMPSMRRG